MNIQYISELLGTGFLAISGALMANEKSNSDWFGVSFIGFITAIGGGSLRDILLGAYPLVWVGNVDFMYAIFVGILLAKIFFKLLIKIRRHLFIFDTLGIAMFTIIGTEKAMSLGVDPIISAIMGMFSAVMGGVLRDVLLNKVPIIFRKEIYATACLAGAILYLILDHFSIDRNISFSASMLLIFIIRFIAVKYHLSLPRFNSEE